MKTCCVDGCSNTGKLTRGMCQAHYQRWWSTRDARPHEALRQMHGLGGTKIYWAWHDMVRRCHDGRSRSYDRYGGRGITVCNEWRVSAAAFYRDMGNPPDRRYQLDRIDNNGQYCKENCHWVLPKDNARNRSTTKLNREQVDKIIASGLPQSKIAAENGVSQSHVSLIKRGCKWRET